MCDWPKYVTCECPELSVPRGLTVNVEEEKEEIYLERWRGGRGLCCSERSGSLPGGPEVWDPLWAVWSEH